MAVRQRGPGTAVQGRSPGPTARQRGSGTILAIGLTAVIGACLIVALTLGMAVQAKQQAQTAADLAALAGAQAVIDGLGSSDACALADRIAAEFSASLVSCGPTAENRLLVICQVGVDLGWLDQKFVRALAEAGPP